MDGEAAETLREFRYGPLGWLVIVGQAAETLREFRYIAALVAEVAKTFGCVELDLKPKLGGR